MPSYPIVGDKDADGNELIFDKWANEVNVRVQAWRLPNDDVRLVIRANGSPFIASATLADYRAQDLCSALARPRWVLVPVDKED